MGVPKFYRWISERYPCLSQVVKDYQIPEFDNFYLDMNGIIHTCSHPNDDDPSFRISEDKIFSSIFTYLEALFRIIKPQKVMFLAVDGVAPRAKMNQQRGRRFRSAKEAQDVVRKALQKGQILPAEPRFDSNCITPGTEFMARLHEHLKYFVAKKLSSDPTWQKVEVILSGHDVPGEGEHKIMDYIRHQKARPDYDPNTRHCLYGLDADLIMLGLLSHEPHFSLLREEVRFGKSQKKQTSPDTITFHLLHLSILREYLDFEFQSLKGKIPFGYDLERIIDDWVLMGFLVGNDFLPNLPNFHIRQDALPFLYSKYMEVLPTLDGYINNGGELHMERFETYLTAVSQFDYNHYNELFDDMKWLEGKGQLGPDARKKKGRSTEHAQKESPDDMFPAGLADFAASDGVDEPDYDENSEEAMKLKRDLGISSLKTYFQEEDKDLSKKFNKEFTDFKATYYQQKMGFLRVDQSVLLEQAKCYVVGIQWVLHYYYSGVPSWSWFYPYHYAPFVSDIHGFNDIIIEFELGKPFFPFEQLLAVLPPASKSLLPKAFQGLMMNEDSPVKDFYPLVFQTDLNGKDQEWEAVVLIPFIDEERLLQAMDNCLQHLTEEEVTRNGFGKCLVCCHDGSAPTTVYPSPWPQMFPELTNCKLRIIHLPPDPFPVDKERLVHGLCDGVKLDVHFPGFPSLKHVPHTGVLEKKGVRVFQAASRGENLFLTLLPRDKPQGCQEVAQDLVGKTLYVGWPYLVEARIWAVSNGTEKYHNVGAPTSHKSQVGGASLRREVLTESAAKQWREDKTIICRRYLERQGINVGNVELLVYAQVLQGKRFVVSKHGTRGTVSLVKEWSPYPEPFLYQTIVKDIAAFAPEYKEQVSSLPDLFPPKSHCFIISPPHYGSLAEVVSVDLNQLRVQVKVTPKPEPDLLSIEDNRKLFVHYLPSHVVANRVGLPTVSLARITGNIQMEKGSRENVKSREKVKIGLNWKFTKRNQEILGYARKNEGGGWTFSPEAIHILKQFMEKFPVMFSYIKANPTEDVYYEQDLFPDPEGSESISAVKEWLKALPSEGADAVDCGSLTLDKPQIAAVEKAIHVMQKQNPRPMKYVKLRVKPSALFKPADRQGNLIPDPDAEYYLFDRVINVSTASAVPFALIGTVTGIMGASNNEGPEMYEVLFDEEFLGGLKLRCSSNRAYRLPSSCLLNISHGKRLEEKKVQKPRKSHTHSGTSYANAAAYNQYEPQMYGGQRQSYHQGQSYTDYGHRHGTRMEKFSGNERQNGAHGSTNGRGGKGGNGAKKILLRNPSNPSQKTEQMTNISSTDELSKAVSALSQLSVSSTQPPSRAEPTEQRITDNTQELTPSVAAMFNAHEQHQTSTNTPTTIQSSIPGSDLDPSNSLKSMLNIGTSSGLEPPPQREIPSNVPKHQPRGPLLPRPPQYPQLQQMRGPIFPHGPAPAYPYGPPPSLPDPMAMLIQTSYAHGYRQPNVYHRNTPQGFVGYVEVGPKKYTGPPSTTAQDARRSAVAIANVDLNNSMYPMYPQQYPPYPIVMPQRPRYDGPPLPFYGQRLPPPRPTRHMHPYQHSVGRGILSTPSFVPLQVQRKHPVKSYSPEKKPTTVLAQSTPPQPMSSEEVQRLETASKDLMQSLNIVPTSSTTEQPVSAASEAVGGSMPEINEEQLERQVEQSMRDVQQTKETIERLDGIIRAISISDDLSKQTETVPVVEGSSSVSGEPVGDTFVQVALASALSGASEESEHFTEAVQPEDTAKPTISEVVVAGEIVGTTTNLESHGSLESGGTLTEPTTSTLLKKQKRQLAALFMNS